MDLTDIENIFFKYSSSWVHFLNLPGVIFDVLEKYFFILPEHAIFSWLVVECLKYCLKLDGYFHPNLVTRC